MKKNEVKRKEKRKRLNLTISNEDSKFLKKENLSPQKIFNLAVEELKAEK